VIGAVIIILVIVIALPVGFAMGGAAASMVLGFFLRDNAEQEHEGSELIDLYT
jgi:hypothetical protein